MLGLLVGQGLIFGSLPFLTRIYSTREIGYSGSFLAAASIVGTVATLRLETLLPAASEIEARWLTRNAMRAVGSISLLSSLVYFLVAHHDLANSLWFGLAVAGLGTAALALQSATRRRRLQGVALSKASQGIGQVGIQVGSGISGLTRSGMQAGIAAGYLFSAFVQWTALRSNPKHGLSGSVSIETRRLRWRQALILTFAGLLNIAAVWISPLFIQHFFGPRETGQLTVAQRLVIAPAGLIVASFAPVVVASIGSTIRAGLDTRPQILVLIRRLLPFGLVTLIATVFVPRSWLEFVLGSEWGHAKDYLAALGPSAAFQVAIGPLGLVLILQGRSRAQLVWDFTRTVTLLTTMTLTAVLSDSAVLTIWAGSIILSLYYLVYLWLILNPEQSRPRHRHRRRSV